MTAGGTWQDVTPDEWQRLASSAWMARGYAYVHGPTRVGAAVLSGGGGIFSGCNVEHVFRSHDIHAEVNALSSMAAAGHKNAVAIVIAAERDRFTPCGACLDWIFELGGPATVVAFQSAPDDALLKQRADELMPHYPA